MRVVFTWISGPADRAAPNLESRRYAKQTRYFRPTARNPFILSVLDLRRGLDQLPHRSGHHQEQIRAGLLRLLDYCKLFRLPRIGRWLALVEIIQRQ